MTNQVLVMIAAALLLVVYLLVVEDIPWSATLEDGYTATYQDRGLLP